MIPPPPHPFVPNGPSAEAEINPFLPATPQVSHIICFTNCGAMSANKSNMCAHLPFFHWGGSSAFYWCRNLHMTARKLQSRLQKLQKMSGYKVSGGAININDDYSTTTNQMEVHVFLDVPMNDASLKQRSLI